MHVALMLLGFVTHPWDQLVLNHANSKKISDFNSKGCSFLRRHMVKCGLDWTGKTRTGLKLVKRGLDLALIILELTILPTLSKTTERVQFTHKPTGIYLQEHNL
jgi:hypothetical protein